MKSTLKNMVLVLFTITAVSAFLVGMVNHITKDTIKKTKDDAKLLALTDVLPEFEGEPAFVHDTMKIEGAQIVATRVSKKADGETVGYAVETHSLTKTGYADKIYLMVGFLEDGTIYNIEVLSQKETPGLGANMEKPGNNLEKGLKGRKASEVVFDVSKNDKNGIDALSGATISSVAYIDAVEAAYAAFLWTTGQREQFETAAGDKPVDTASGATTTTEPAAQEGDVDNE